MQEEEILDVVDANDVVIGQVARGELYEQLDEVSGYVRAANLLIINNKGQIWIPKRAMTQRIKPGGLDFSAGGHVSTGEDYAQAICREAAEEIGLTIVPDQLLLLPTVTPAMVGGYYFVKPFVYFSDTTPTYSTDEFISDEWIAPETLLDRLAAGEYAKDGLALTVQFWIDYRDSHQSNG